MEQTNCFANPGKTRMQHILRLAQDHVELLRTLGMSAAVWTGQDFKIGNFSDLEGALTDARFAVGDMTLDDLVDAAKQR